MCRPCSWTRSRPRCGHPEAEPQPGTALKVAPACGPRRVRDPPGSVRQRTVTPPTPTYAEATAHGPPKGCGVRPNPSASPRKPHPKPVAVGAARHCTWSNAMNTIIYIVGLIVVIGFVLSFLGLR